MFSNIRVFSSELTGYQVANVLELQLQHQSFQYIEYSGLISFRIDWFDLLTVQGTVKSLEKELSDTDFSVCFIHSFINLTTIC